MKRTSALVRGNQKLFIIYIIGTIFIFSCMFLILKQTAMGKEQRRIEELFAMVDSEEQVYVDQVRGELAKQGYANCGVTMTKIVNANGEFFYQVQINHRNLKNIEINMKEEIVNSLNTLPNGVQEVLSGVEDEIQVEFVYEII
jgi:hypothetical protein